MGTGAFSTVRLERQMSIKIVPDDEALLSLKAPYSGDTIQIDDGKLIVDAAEEDGDKGLKAGSTHEFGEWNPSGKVVTPAIQVVNKGSQPQNIEFNYSWDPDKIGGSSMRWFFSWRPTGQHKKQFSVDSSQEETSITARDITPGNPIDIAFDVDADAAGDDVSGEISLESTPVEEDPSGSGK